ncbi:hairy-related 5 [Oreochromis aureus]|uniref:BHLH domain-containing protein n=1 Tax=Oreochromis aureus TaxID=47969 RepID=A0A668V913_OREAU|nr:hairy-related 5 [Oreochromis aureus]
MKVISSPGARGQRAARRISKPQMEKRRRERINHSLETLRVLMLESTHNEKLKNPKVEKAEILESVVDFLKAEKDVQKDHQASKRALSVEQRPACACQSSYHDGMRTCLLRVNQFIASKSQEAGEPSGAAVRASFTLPEIPMHPTTPGHIHQSLIPPSPATAAALPPHPLPFHHPQLSHHYLKQTAGFHGATSNLSPAGVGHIPDPLWRPWPQ